MENLNNIDKDKISENILNVINDPNSCIFVAQTGNTLSGFIHLSFRCTIFHDGSSGLIDELVVAHKFRGKGVGKRLVMAAIKKCSEIGCIEVEVSTEKNNPNALGFY